MWPPPHLIPNTMPQEAGSVFQAKENKELWCHFYLKKYFTLTVLFDASWPLWILSLLTLVSIHRLWEHINSPGFNYHPLFWPAPNFSILDLQAPSILSCRHWNMSIWMFPHHFKFLTKCLTRPSSRVLILVLEAHPPDNFLFPHILSPSPCTFPPSIVRLPLSPPATARIQARR